MKTLIAFIALILPATAFCQDIIRFPSAYPNNQPYVIVVPQQPRNNLEQRMDSYYQQEATENLQLRNQLLEKQIYENPYEPKPNNEHQNNGPYEILGY